MSRHAHLALPVGLGDARAGWSGSWRSLVAPGLELVLALGHSV